ncbi:arginine repressor [bacterium]|jgi:transcriptional regulator of arginine metabolism|nr:MAG: arginine repressor [bacterium]TAM91845.1 MAG: arginine repressor [bacterium]
MKNARHRAILQTIASRPVHSQEELMQHLAEQGFEVTQATVSRDIKELGLLKVPLKKNGNGATSFKYVEPGASREYPSRLHRIVAEFVEQINGSVNLIVLRTPPGSAMMLASAIDQSTWPEVIGTIGGDDTVVVVLSDPERLPIVMQRFQDMKDAGS